MKKKFQNLTIEFHLELQAILDVELICGYSEHPFLGFKAAVLEEKA